MVVDLDCESVLIIFFNCHELNECHIEFTYLRISITYKIIKLQNNCEILNKYNLLTT